MEGRHEIATLVVKTLAGLTELAEYPHCRQHKGNAT